MEASNKRISTERQLSVLALLARGDSYADIHKATGVSMAAVTQIKKRNPDALKLIQTKLINHEVSNSKRILSKSQQLIERKLDRAMSADQQREEAYQQFTSGEIEYKEYRALLDKIYDPGLTELNGIVRESFNQSQIEDGKPTSIGAAQSNTADFLALADAIKSGSDEVELQKLVFRSSDREVIEVENDKPDPV